MHIALQLARCSSTVMPAEYTTPALAMKVLALCAGRSGTQWCLNNRLRQQMVKVSNDGNDSNMSMQYGTVSCTPGRAN